MRYFAKLAYLGKNYHGWQIQPKAISVQETIEKALSMLLRTPIQIIGAGRTDAGVHAKEMFIHFDVEQTFDENKLVHRLNSFLPNDIVFYDIFKVGKNAHTRFDATARSYEYHIHIGKTAFEMDTVWQMPIQNLNVDAMNQAANILLQHTNFKCFSKSNTDVKTYNCKITEAYWETKGNYLIFHITADRFLRNMVRAIVGTLINVGLNKITVAQINNIIVSENRSNAGASVPAQGLFLTKITYPETIFHD